ncbi:uncharacterized protein LOC114538372 [Dendronephthya gigantea]|uniref:uncharacterized protein LOC114538372 n=1 Tax=Dendronephthya gigantea TaxID=151771 RepID=UPI00106C73C3|nr:uncharacterized protein LOC114538372 [Dendronephthya gigantea]XP_028415350.1 uncharacterized protein LOC114538372 [Dendronephthya gigantea]
MSMRGSRSYATSTDIPIPRVKFKDEDKKSRENYIIIKTIEIVRNSNEYKSSKELKLADFDIKAKGFNENQICPLFRKYDSRDFMIARFDSKCPKQVTTQILSTGVDVCYEKKPESIERYTFFAHSASQLRSRVCLLYNNNPNVGKAEDIISKFGDFDKIKTSAKRAARIGLLLSTAGKTVELKDEDISRIGDVERKGYTFTDGCGYISPGVAQQVVTCLGISEKFKHQKYPFPSVLQVRLLGCKGVLALKPSLEKGVEVRKSMEKFNWLLPGPHPLGVVDKGYSRPYEIGSLNKQFILLLSALGIKDEVFLKKQKTYFQEIKSLRTNKETAFTYLCAFGEIDIAERLLKSTEEIDSIDDIVLKKINSIQQRAYSSPKTSDSELEKKKKTPALRLKIPIEKSRNVYGISDPSENDLKYGTCFFQPTIRGEAKPVVGRILAAKNPCYSPGDVRVLDCIDVPCCHHLVDCIVFPTDGERPHPDEIAGSDLDGDKFFVCWDPDLVPYESHDPVSYPAAKVPPQKNIQQKDLIAYFARYSNSTIGKIDFLFSRWADQKGVASMECQELSALFSRAVDSAKTGERVNIPKHLQIASNPKDDLLKGNFVWHQMAAEASLFIENKVIGPEIYHDMQLTAGTLKNILSNELISVSDYQLFRFLCKWADLEHDEESESQVSQIAKECIDFTTFSLPQLRRAQIDCPSLGKHVLLNPFIRSSILSESDWQVLISQLSDQHSRYSLVLRACAEEFPWDILNNILTSGLAKILVFKFLIGSVEWVCVLNIPQQLQSRDTLEVDESEHILPRAFLFIHQENPISERLILDSTYSFLLENQRLQIYQGTKTRTFISFNINDANDLSVVSVDLNRFDTRLSRKFGGIRVRKEAFVELEVYCLDPYGFPISKIHFTEPPTSLAQRDESEITLEVTFQSVEEDFPNLGDEYSGIYLEAQEEMTRLHNLHDTSSLTTGAFTIFSDLLERMDDPLERHDWTCKLESLLDECGIKYGDAEKYQTLMLYLLEGLKKCSSRVISGIKVNITLLGRVRRVLNRMRENDVQFSVENIMELFGKLLFVHDYSTSIYVVRLLQQGLFPISKDEFSVHEDSYSYFIHWSSLLYMEILEDVKEQEYLEMGGQSVACEGKVSMEIEKEDGNDDSDGKTKATKNNNQPMCTIFVFNGEINCLVGDYLALSPRNAYSAFREREYIMEVKKSAGKHLYADPVWPNDKGVPDRLSRSPGWKISPFPNLVSYNRMLEALKKLCTETTLENVGIFGELLNTWSGTKSDREIHEDEQRIPKNFEKDACGSKDGEEPEINEGASRRDSGLNPSQENAVQQACENSLTLIQGPPGTGKSKTSANIIRKLLAQNREEKILAVAETNEGVDNLLEKIVQVSDDIPQSQMLRIGSSTWMVRESLREYSLESRYEERSKGKRVREDWMDKKIVKKILKEARVVCTTCISAGSKIFEEVEFEKLLVDEASQATEPAILVPMCRGSRVLVLVGDDNQLPPTIKNNENKQLGDTTFSRLRKFGYPVHLLDTQYRMHPCISEFPSTTFYKGKLKNGVTEKDRPIPKGFSWPDKTRPLAFVTILKDTEKRSGRSRKNLKEAEIVKRVVDDVIIAGDLSKEEIGIVTPYSAQVKLLKEMIQKNYQGISVRSVDGFQGQERELIIFSAVRSNDVGKLGFLDDDKRMNVLLTRARRGLIVIGNGSTLAQNDSTWKKWVNWMEKEKLIIDSETLFPSSSEGLGMTAGRGGRGGARGRGGRIPAENSRGRGTRGRRGKIRGTQRFK